MRITFRDGIFIAASTYDERTLLSKAGFTFHPGLNECSAGSAACPACKAKFNRGWWTKKKEAAARVSNFADEKARVALADHLKAVEMSRATDTDIEIPHPPGLNYFGYQKAGIHYMAQREATLLGDEMGLGKQQPVDSKVLTPDGWRTIGSLKPGDKVIGSNGRPVRVKGVFPQGVKPNYRVHFSDGSSVESGPEHLWTFLYRKGGRTWQEITVTTEQIRNGSTVEMEWGNQLTTSLDLSKTPLYLPMLSAPAQFATRTLPLPPYLVGQLIANGYLTGSSPTAACHTLDWSAIKERLAEEHVDVGSMQTYGLAHRFHLRGITDEVRSLEINRPSKEKRIPRIYLEAHPRDRVALLQGLMDGDGSISKKKCRVTYHTISAHLAADVQELVEGLGGIASIRKYDRTAEGKPVEFQVRVRLPSGICPFSVPRKAGRYKPGSHALPRRVLTKVEYTRKVESVCIAVEAEDQLYTTEHCILTHNTPQALGVINYDKTIRNVLVVCPAALRINWYRESKRWLVRDERRWLGHIVDEDKAVPPEANFVIANYNRIMIGFKRCTGSCGGERTKAKEVTCPTCQGTGNGERHPELCRQCAGKKVVRCPECNGRGKMPALNLKVVESLMSRDWDLAVFDECFPFETKVTTRSGPTSIGEIVEKKLAAEVLCYDVTNQTYAWRKIRNWYRKPLRKSIVRVVHENGEFFCTSDHKIWTQHGFKKAVELSPSDRLVADVPVVRKEVHPIPQETVLLDEVLGPLANGRSKASGSVSPERHLRTEVKHRTTTSRRSREDAQEQPHEALERSPENDSISPRDALPHRTRGERSSRALASENAGGCAWMADGSCGEDTASLETLQGASAASLPDRCCGVAPASGGGDRRSFAQHIQGARLRSPEVPGAIAPRVVSVSILEPADLERLGLGRSGCPFVYDIEVEEHHNYFADGVLVSNCHFIKNPKAARTRAVIGQPTKKKPGLIDKAKKKLFLTGTPLPNRPIEMWPVLSVCAPKEFGSLRVFAKRYCDAREEFVGKNKTVWKADGASNLEELQEKLRATCLLRRLKKDVLKDLPPKIRQVIPLIPTEAARKLITEEMDIWNKKFGDQIEMIKESMVLAEEEKDAPAYQKAVEGLQYIQRVAFMEMAKVRHDVAVAKMPSVIEHLEAMFKEGVDKIVCFAHHHDVIKGISNHFGDKAVSLYGATDKDARQQAVDRFQTDKKVKLFVGGIMAAGTGLTLTAASNVVFAELDWTPSNITQAEDRCIAEGQLVHTRRGLIPIEQVVVGDYAYSHLGRWRKVTDTSRREHRGLMTQISYRRWNQPLLCTHDHKLFALKKDAERPEWIEAHRLLPGDFLFMPHQFGSENTHHADQYRQVTGVETFPCHRPVFVHDLTIEDDHSFVVGQAAVHNCHRIGQIGSVLVRHLVLDGSLDARMAQLLVEKQAIADRALDNSTDVATKGLLETRPEAPPAEPVPLWKKGLLREAMVALAQRRDPETEGDHGFSQFDSVIGQKLATWRGEYSDKQAHLALKLAKKYRRQLAEELQKQLEIYESPSPAEARRLRKKSTAPAEQSILELIETTLLAS